VDTVGTEAEQDLPVPAVSLRVLACTSPTDTSTCRWAHSATTTHKADREEQANGVVRAVLEDQEVSALLGILVYPQPLRLRGREEGSVEPEVREVMAGTAVAVPPEAMAASVDPRGVVARMSPAVRPLSPRTPWLPIWLSEVEEDWVVKEDRDISVGAVARVVWVVSVVAVVRDSEPRMGL
jgi:hypothetical protein